MVVLRERIRSWVDELFGKRISAGVSEFVSSCDNPQECT